MTITIIVGIVLVLIAAGLLLRARQHYLADRPRSERPAPHTTPSEAEVRHLFGLIAHELRTPLGAIVGYAELLGDGLLGPLPDRAGDAVHRISLSGAQLRHLVDGLSDLMMGDTDATLDLQQVDTAEAAQTAAASARSLAAGRSVQLEVDLPADLPVLHTDPARLGAALDLAIGAAVRASPGASLRLVFAGRAGALQARVEGTALDPARDMPRPAPGDEPGSGPALRLAMAARSLQLLGGQLKLEGQAPSTLVLSVPSVPSAPPPS